MGRRGPGALPQAEKREQFARLIVQGFNNSEACRIVGINRRTGKRWRHGRTITTRDGRNMLPWSPRGRAGVSGRSRTGTSLSRSGCGSLTCARRGMASGRSRRRRGAARRRSAGSCAGTGIRTVASTGRSRRISWPCGGVPGRGRARSPLTRCCASSCRSGWSKGGAQSRSAGRCAATSRTSRRGMSCTRPSTRRFAGLSSAACRVSCPSGRCAPGGGGAGRIGGLASGGRTGSSR